MVSAIYGGGSLRTSVLLATAIALSACARSSVLDVASDTIQVTTSAAVVCGQTGSQEVASKTAAIETLKRGYDKYIIVGGDYQNNVRVVGYTPITASTSSYGTISGFGAGATYNGHSATYINGGSPITGGTHDQTLMIKMFRKGETGSSNAVDARSILGPDWQKDLKRGKYGTC